MAKIKVNRLRVSDEELEQNDIKKDFFEDYRSSDGYIKVSVSPLGAALLNQSLDEEIERKQKELEALRKRRSFLEDLEESLSKKEKKKLKKEKKKKKKEKKRLKNLPESSKLLYSAIEEYKSKFFKKDKDKDDKKSKFDGVFSVSKKPKEKEEDEEEKQRKKEEKERKEFEKRFEEPLALIRENLIDMSEALNEINEMIKETKESRARNKHILLKDLISAKTNLFNARASSARSMADIQKARIDLELKKIKEQGSSVDERTKNIALMNKFFPMLLASGKLNSVKSYKNNDDDDDDDYKKDKKKKKKEKFKEYEEKFEKRVAKLLDEGELELTPHEASIDMEGKYKIIVMKSIKTGDWKFAATDLNGRIIKDFEDKYPGLMPKRKHVKLKFDDEKDIAKDMNTDTIYQVIHIPYI